MTPMQAVLDQLPERVRGRLDLKLVSDPYHLRAEVIHVYRDETFACPVEFEWRGHKRVGCRVPDWFIAHLLTVPRD